MNAGQVRAEYELQGQPQIHLAMAEREPGSDRRRLAEGLAEQMHCRAIGRRIEYKNAAMSVDIENIWNVGVD